MNEPFERVKDPYAVLLDDNGNEIPIFHVSRLSSSCYWNYARDLVSPLPITEHLGKIFDEGSAGHWDKEILWTNARCVIGIEDYYKIMHDKKLFVLSTKYDRLEFDFNGKFLRDWKSVADIIALKYFLDEGVNEDHTLQISLEAYILYIHHGQYLKDGVITKYVRDTPRAEASLPCETLERNEVRDRILRHPVIHFYLGKINGNRLIRLCIAQMSKKNTFGKNQSWKCGNCQYNPTYTGNRSDCPIYEQLQKAELKHGN